MKYIDIQLTDKELWAQFQAKYQAGEYADALALLQTLTPNAEAYVWEKYDIIADTYKTQRTQYSDGISNPTIPSDADSSVKYGGYTLDSSAGTFTMTGEGSQHNITNGYYYYYPSSSSTSIIYEIRITNTNLSIRSWAVYKITSVADTYKQGSTYYGTVTSEDETAYPADGEQDGYWYVLVSETTEGGYKGLIAKALNTLTNYIVRVENLNDSTFKADKPPVQTNQPTQTAGQLWFQVTN